jgi:hypothetical protein
MRELEHLVFGLHVVEIVVGKILWDRRGRCSQSLNGSMGQVVYIHTPVVDQSAHCPPKLNCFPEMGCGCGKDFAFRPPHPVLGGG